MRLKHKPWAKEKLQQHPEVVVPEPEKLRGEWQTQFYHNHPIHVEIGTGKGQFITGMAEQQSQGHFIGIELAESVIVTALDKVLATDNERVRLIHGNANDLLGFFAENEVTHLYLNFSDPWPKHRHEKRRLTHDAFLRKYEQILEPGGMICLKTDNRGLFEYSLDRFAAYGMHIEQVNWDLHQSVEAGNVMTEYEEKFSAKGHPIYRCEAHFAT